MSENPPIAEPPNIDQLENAQTDSQLQDNQQNVMIINRPEHADANENNPCKKALNLTTFIAGMFNEAKLCTHLKRLLELDQEVLPLTSILCIIHNLLKENDEVQIPIQLLSHFAPYKSLQKETILTILCHHLRFNEPKLRYLFINPLGLCTIKVIDFQPTEPTPEVQTESNILDCQICKTCSGFYLREKYENHIRRGPFAENHYLHKTSDIEVQMLLACNAFDFLGHRAQCKSCEAEYSILQSTQEILDHAILHASVFLKANENLTDAKRILWAKLNQTERNLPHICILCNRMFPTLQVLYLHLSLFEHRVAKHMCMECKVCIYSTMEEHIERMHEDERLCPFMCKVPPNVLAHHLNSRHLQLNHLIPNTEICKIREITSNRMCPDTVTGISGQITFNRQIIKLVRSISNQSIQTVFTNMYKVIDVQGWDEAEVIYKARVGNKHIPPYITRDALRNKLKVIAKLIIKQHVKTTNPKREESPYLIFNAPVITPDDYSFPHEVDVLYTEDLLDHFQVILLGNDLFGQVKSDRPFPLFNLSTPEPAAWTFPSTGTQLPTVLNDFTHHALREANKIMRGCTKTVILEASLKPILMKIPGPQRVHFLQNNIENLAKAILEIAVKVQARCKNLAISTYLHSINSAYLLEELPYINQYNELLKVGALHLQMGIVDLARLGINVLQTNSNPSLLYYRMDPEIKNEIFDYKGNLSPYGQLSVKRMILELEQEIILLTSQMERAIELERKRKRRFQT